MTSAWAGMNVGSFSREDGLGLGRWMALLPGLALSLQKAGRLRKIRLPRASSFGIGLGSECRTGAWPLGMSMRLVPSAATDGDDCSRRREEALTWRHSRIPGSTLHASLRRFHE